MNARRNLWASRGRRQLRWEGGMPLLLIDMLGVKAELVQASATRVLFDQCRAVLGSVGVQW